MSNEFRFLGQTIPNLAIISGLILIIWAFFSYFASGSSSFTALIPSFFGMPLFILGVLSNRDESKRHHYMHASMIFALFSAFGGLRIFQLEDPSNLALASHIILLIVGVIFMVGGILSFRHARKLRESLGE
jgi:glucose uptake protein GlcU